MIALAVAITAVTAQEDCQAAYKQCIADGYAKVKCGCDLETCSGEDPARIRDFCATATANLTAPSTTSSIITGTPGSQPSGQPAITAAEGSLPLGATCSDTKQCANGAQCWGSHEGAIRECGNFNADCTADSQCAYNTCNTQSGLCNGFLPSESYPANTASQTGTVTATTSAASATSTGYACNPAHQYPAGQVCSEIGGQLTLVTGGSPAATAAATATATAPFYGGGNITRIAPTGTGAIYPSGTITPYQGDASVVDTLSGLAALVAGVVAYVL